MNPENDALPLSGISEQNNEYQSSFPGTVNSYGVTAFLIQSLEKIKTSTHCEVIRGVIDHYIQEYILDVGTHEHPELPDLEAEIQMNNPSFSLYARTAYRKVLKEEEYLNKIISRLIHDAENK
ncbi:MULTISPECIES: hypothetical protein [Chryseobacterium]|uniref:Uncharacterized protein n=1 Tax=Chryseobacterium camelliae TaxID=1265445 RepID=A0ABU0TGS8_9FLAO|nr:MULTISPECIES: hypothetical protein [Chryseobacterium]MDT3405933.1 hypothetical protein [Pseudacidovorax intermedius]MDQ1096263.1 hypothetical protein [Chryseobacterium camelliae]MDQ1100200.1 hypothetical protein [Chryseobacterium sp. SORGH_AS_1048]MDR6087545.1 hypothetical protein [Chryseobacterium sp. SORGH_AS_0909]MDR6131919.1 hypothetical protein [Chryseobacterium sp. SORGH_AS_1175]